ncbi:MAG: PilZ domain-containing protein [Nannocystaceae bacterium]|nr:PilZ domain-containing protein [Deltaproteobacteria bacterium]MBP7288713.1 PilZ domain-containing protein [Nannocystaceae bacterium]
MSDQERRAHPRSPASLATRIWHEERLLLSARTLDISLSGALLHGSVRLDPGEIVRVEVSRGGLRNPLVLRAEVVRIETPSPLLRRHGIAVRWLDADVADHAALASLLRANPS